MMRSKMNQEQLIKQLSDSDPAVRWDACGLLHDNGDEGAVSFLVERLQRDPDPQVRGTAAYALGGIGSPAAIPALIETMDSDHAVDQLGHSPSSCAATALDEILGTNETQIRISNSLRTLPAAAPDLEKLKREAWAYYQNWKR